MWPLPGPNKTLWFKFTINRHGHCCSKSQPGFGEVVRSTWRQTDPSSTRPPSGSPRSPSWWVELTWLLSSLCFLFRVPNPSRRLTWIRIVHIVVLSSLRIGTNSGSEKRIWWFQLKFDLNSSGVCLRIWLCVVYGVPALWGFIALDLCEIHLG